MAVFGESTKKYNTRNKTLNLGQRRNEIKKYIYYIQFSAVLHPIVTCLPSFIAEINLNDSIPVNLT